MAEMTSVSISGTIITSPTEEAVPDLHTAIESCDTADLHCVEKDPPLTEECSNDNDDNRISQLIEKSMEESLDNIMKENSVSSLIVNTNANNNTDVSNMLVSDEFIIVSNTISGAKESNVIKENSLCVTDPYASRSSPREHNSKGDGGSFVCISPTEHLNKEDSSCISSTRRNCSKDDSSRASSPPPEHGSNITIDKTDLIHTSNEANDVLSHSLNTSSNILDTSTEEGAVSTPNTSMENFENDEDYESKRRMINEELAAINNKEDEDETLTEETESLSNQRNELYDNQIRDGTSGKPQVSNHLDGDSEDDEEKEEGELEDDEEGDSAEKVKSSDLTVNMNPITSESAETIEPPPSSVTPAEGVSKKEDADNGPVLDVRSPEDKKRDKKHKKRKKEEDVDDTERNKKKKLHHHESDEDSDDVTAKFRRGGAADNSDFDAMLQLEMLRRAGGERADYRHGYDSDGEEGAGARLVGVTINNKRRGRRSPLPLSKTEALCVHFLEGTCTKGNECQYSHNVNHNMVLQPHQRKMELCKFYMMKCCAKRQKCLYMHKDFPCKHYHTGMKCVSADKCQFSHDPLSAITRNILLKHLELAPKDILGSFPRLNKTSAHLIVHVTEAYRCRETVDPSNIADLRDWRDMGFKYVDRAVKSLHRQQRREARATDGQQQQQSDDDAGDEGTENISVPPDSNVNGAPEGKGVESAQSVGNAPRIQTLEEAAAAIGFGGPQSEEEEEAEERVRRHGRKKCKRRHRSGHGDDGHHSDESNRRRHESSGHRHGSRSQRDRRHQEQINDTEDNRKQQTTGRASEEGNSNRRSLEDPGSERKVRQKCPDNRSMSRSPDLHHANLRDTRLEGSNDRIIYKRLQTKNISAQQYSSEDESSSKRRKTDRGPLASSESRLRFSEGGPTRHHDNPWYSSDEEAVDSSGAVDSKSPRLMMDLPDASTSSGSITALLAQYKKAKQIALDREEGGFPEDDTVDNNFTTEGRPSSRRIRLSHETSAKSSTKDSIPAKPQAPAPYDPLLMFRQQQQKLQKCQEEEQQEHADDPHAENILKTSLAAVITTSPTNSVSPPPKLCNVENQSPSRNSYTLGNQPPTHSETSSKKAPSQVGSGLLNLNLSNIDVPSDLIKVLSDLKNQTKLLPNSVVPADCPGDTPTTPSFNRDPRHARTQRDSLDSKNSIDGRNTREPIAFRESMNCWDPRESNTFRDSIGHRDLRESNAFRNSIDSRDPRETNAFTDSGNFMDPREPEVFRNCLDSRDPRETRDSRNPRQSRDPREAHDPWTSRVPFGHPGTSSLDTRPFRDPRLARDISMENNSNPLLRERKLRSSSDSDDRGSDTNVDLELQNLNMPPLSVFTVTGDVPFHVPAHAPVTVLNASITAHPPILYRLVIMSVPKANYANITRRLDKDDPRVQEDPRLHNLFFGSTSKGSSPKHNSVYGGDPESPSPPPPPEVSSTPPPPPENRDPRMKRDLRNIDSRDPRNKEPGLNSPNIDPRGLVPNNNITLDPRSADGLGSTVDPHNQDPRNLDPNFPSILNYDPRLDSRGDPRLSNNRSSSDPRLENRDPRAKPLEEDLPNMDPRQRGNILGSIPPPHHQYSGMGHHMGNMIPQINGMPGVLQHGGMYPPNIGGPHDIHMNMDGSPMMNPYMPGYVPGHNNMLNAMPNMSQVPNIMQSHPQMVPPDALYPHQAGGSMGMTKDGHMVEWLPHNSDPRLKKALEPHASFSPPPPLV